MFGRKKQVLSREQSLSARPVRNENLTVSRDDDGNVVITIPRRKTWWADAVARLLRMPDKRKIALDEVGTAVWDQCDGKHTVESIIDNFVEKYKLNRREAEVSVFAFFKDLTRRGFVGLVVDGQGNGKKSREKRRK
jgi:hypothetical protein